METITPNSQDIENALRLLLTAIGENPDRDGLKDTPRRVMRMADELFRGYDQARMPHITTFPNDSHTTAIITDSGDFHSICEHHLLPFFGTYHLAYRPSPDGLLLGISKISRVVAFHAARLQMQERLAGDIIATLEKALNGTARGFALLLKGHHLCKSMRGARNRGDMTVTCFTGDFDTSSDLRRDFLSSISTR